MGEEEETVTANIHRTPVNRLVKHSKSAAGTDVPVARRKTEIKRGDEGRGGNLEALTSSCFLLLPIIWRPNCYFKN